MTIVEFYDRTPIENMVSCLANRPQKIIFVGEKSRLEKQRDQFYRFLDEVENYVTVLEFCPVNKNSLSDIVDKLTRIVEENPECSFDLTGGDDLTLVAIGVVYERMKDRHVQLHRYNIRTGRVYDCDRDGSVVSDAIPDITVEQNIVLHGGVVVTADQRGGGTAYWDFDEEFVKDLEKMWKICRKNCSLWNYQLSMLANLEDQKVAAEEEEELLLYVDIERARAVLDRTKNGLRLDGIFQELERAGLIREFSTENGCLSFYYKNRQIRRCLTKAGTLLELKTYLAAMQAENPDGSFFYTDGLTGVSIDWDGDAFGGTWTENEVDVILMKGLIPVFISCKNGAVGSEELYKLNTVTERFGGPYAKKVLVATTMGRAGSQRASFIERAQDMGIKVIDGVHEMTDAEFEKALCSLEF